MHGKGTYVWPDGKKYVGNFNMDKKDGFGVFSWPDGRQYEGSFKNGKQHGNGKFRSPKGAVKRGVWEDGKLKQWVAVVLPDGTEKPITEQSSPSRVDPNKLTSTVNAESAVPATSNVGSGGSSRLKA